MMAAAACQIGFRNIGNYNLGFNFSFFRVKGLEEENYGRVLWPKA